ncbi:GNAT family N-acetyltransferase [Halobacillus sp. A1]|uniref:GNAT family N-acetyltransferase n=1 Tax=Halobacillus sp. A1 TaxID=2880262 RepID=UPI0020A684B6|nr:GNAT family N-acetyltransferase [Halobacillus sp. A1]MCP3031467.1 GNAT family N-acetyltransferase [Halobacillus sp. A1]
MAIRNYAPGDEEQIQELFAKTFNHNRSYEEWEWKFKKHPHYEEPTILVWEEDGKILGHISLWVNKAYIGNEIHKVGLRIDTMVDPQTRGKGIYRKLNEKLSEIARKENIVYLYGFPAPKAKDLLIKYSKGVHITDIPRLINIQRPFSLLSSKLSVLKLLKPVDELIYNFKNRKKMKPSNELSVVEIENFDDRFTSLDADIHNDGLVKVVRDTAYLNWRYTFHPEKKYTILALEGPSKALRGYIVFTIENKESYQSGMILDWCCLEGTEGCDLLLDSALKYMRNAAIIQTWALPHTSIYSQLINNSFYQKDRPVPLVGIQTHDEFTGFEDESKWFITPGDVDSF